MGSNSDGQLGVGRNPEWTSVPIQIHGTKDDLDDDDGDEPVCPYRHMVLKMILMMTMTMKQRAHTDTWC